MSHRRPEPSQAILEQTLRRALRLAADSIEPGADGLDRIRTKIAAGPPPPVPMTRWAAWRSTYLTTILTMLGVVATHLESIAMRTWYAFCAVVDRVWYMFADFMEQFRPEDGGTGWVRWLRPAAALSAAFLVVVGLSFAVTTVPTALINVTRNHTRGGVSGNGEPASRHSGSLGRNGGQTPPDSTSSGSSSPGCTSRSGSPGASPSAAPSKSAKPSPSSTPSPSLSPSPSPSISGTGSPSPSVTPIPTDTPSAGQTPSQSAPPGLPGSSQSVSRDAQTAKPAGASPTTGPNPRPSAKGSRSRC
jgi:hypothetical protein